MRIRRVILLIFLILFFGIAAVGIVFLSRWNKPLGPSLNLPTYTASSTLLPPTTTATSSATPTGPTATRDPLTTATPPTATSVPPTPLPSPTATRQPLCGELTSMVILGIGVDEGGANYMYGLADSIHVMRVDFTVPDIMVVDFPRDLWVEIPEISDHYGITHGKLNQAYLFGNKGMGYYDGPGEGPGLLARTLDLNYGMRPDHYVAINVETFIRVIDAVGGIDITVDEPIDLNWGPTTPDPRLFFSVGTHHLDGETAMIMARNRIPSTFQRMKYQKIILSALREKLLSPSMIPQIPKLAAQFLSSVQTDLSPADINSLVCILQAVPRENIHMDSFPREMFTANATYDEYRNLTTFTYSVDAELLRAMVAQFMSGIWPMP